MFLYYPPLGTARSDVLTYLADHDGRLLSVLAGLLACFGDMAQFLAGQAVGYAVRTRKEASDSLAQAAAIVQSSCCPQTAVKAWSLVVVRTPRDLATKALRQARPCACTTCSRLPL